MTTIIQSPPAQSANENNEVDKLFKSFYGANFAKAKKNSIEGPEEAKRRFKARFPFADMSKFEFDVELSKNGDISEYNTSFKISDTESYDITSKTFLKNKDYVKYLKIKKWPKIWEYGGNVPSFDNLRYPKDPERKGWGHHA